MTYGYDLILVRSSSFALFSSLTLPHVSRVRQNDDLQRSWARTADRNERSKNYWKCLKAKLAEGLQLSDESGQLSS